MKKFIKECPFMEKYLSSSEDGQDKLCRIEWVRAFYYTRTRTVMEIISQDEIFDKYFGSSWYEITELGGLDFEFYYKDDIVYIKNNQHKTYEIRFKYINSEIVIDKNNGMFNTNNKPWFYTFCNTLKDIKELFIRIPMFSNSIVNIDLDYVKPRLTLPENKPVLKTFYDRMRDNHFSFIMRNAMYTTHHSERDLILTEYVIDKIRKIYSNIKHPQDKLDALYDAGWRLMSPDNMADLFDLVEIFLVNDEMFGTPCDYLYLIKNKDCMGIANSTEYYVRPSYFANTLFNINRLVSV